MDYGGLTDRILFLSYKLDNNKFLTADVRDAILKEIQALVKERNNIDNLQRTNKE